MNENPIKIAVFDDNNYRRDSLCMLVNSSPRMKCTGTFFDCSNVVADVRKAAPDVVLMDIDMPNVNGIEGVKLIKMHFPKVQVLMQTVFEDDNKIFASICAGASGYILKKSSPAQLLQAVEDVFNGDAAMTASIAKKVLSAFQKNVFFENNIEISLTPREKEVLSYLVKGYSHKMVASACGLSIHTINTHIKNIYEKLQVNSVAEAVVKALNHKLI
ncbi:MAG TPA: response regulator transcription factor [Niabella sp.]|nr:response regulator transcription factor [Niabella sp.]HOZ95623.1 response regulator transcription factor [Niabella sp.]HQW13863.1 response regulator transcription factor [Niabella sp.]HQX19244.1 response regulator transcription factor [Niabella sp.]HQX41037.1 response regulator transcription factor [Niabella sp.]